MIEVHQLTKWYGPTLAVDDLSFKIPVGQIVGFLGPNGAGKSTTLRMLTGYLPPTSGAATIAGHNVLTASQAARANIGYMPEGTPIYPEMRVTEYLDYRGRLLGMDRTRRKQRMDVVIDRCGLSAVRRRAVGKLSKGNRQRVGLAQALLNEPPVLILDEPTAGLDPNQIRDVRRTIREFGENRAVLLSTHILQEVEAVCDRRGKHTVILSSHILPEVEKTADHVMIISGGKLVAEGSPDALRQQVRTGARVLVEAKAGADEVESLLGALPDVAKVDANAIDDQWCRAVVTPKGDADTREAIGRALATAQRPIREIRFETASLEAFFVQITDQGPENRDQGSVGSRTAPPDTRSPSSGP